MVLTESEIEKAAESTPEKPSSPQGTDETTSKPRMLTEEEHHKLLTDAVNAARGEEGRKQKRALTEAQNRANDTLAALQKSNDELQAALDEMAADDEDKSRTAKLLKDNLRREKELEAKMQAYEPKIAKADEYELTELCNQIVKDYDGADAARLKRIASRTKFSEDEDKIDQIRSLADDIWAKKTVTTQVEHAKEEPRKMDSGISNGNTKGKTPTLEELRASSPEATEAKVKSGEWMLPGWR